MATKLKKYITQVRGIKITEAAKQLNISRTYLSALCNGKAAGKATAIDIEDWSDGWIKASELIFKQKEA